MDVNSQSRYTPVFLQRHCSSGVVGLVYIGNSVLVPLSHTRTRTNETRNSPSCFYIIRKFKDNYYQDDFKDYGGAENYNENVNMNASGSTIFMLPASADPPSGTVEKSKLNPTHVLGTR